MILAATDILVVYSILKIRTEKLSFNTITDFFLGYLANNWLETCLVLMTFKVVIKAQISSIFNTKYN